MNILTKTKTLAHSLFNMIGLEVRRSRPLGSLGEPRSSNFNEEIIIADLIQRINPSEHFYVDIGAGDGETMSNSYPLIRQGWEGLAVEGDGGRFATLAHRYAPFPNAKLSRNFVTPDNVISIFKGYNVPHNFAFLSLDIDGYDYFVLEKILSTYRPLLICAEINEKIPPPLAFTVLYSPAYEWTHGSFYGQSISMLEQLALKNNYKLVKLEYNNAFLIPKECTDMPHVPAAEAYKVGYLDKKDRLSLMPWNEEFEVALKMSPKQATAFFNEKFKEQKEKFMLQ